MRKPKSIMLVEDDEIDQLTLKRCLRELDCPYELLICQNGEDALTSLRTPEFGLPAFILLDINMPKMNGIEFLKEVKADEKLKKIPVVVLTTSRDQQDRSQAFSLSAAGYMLKTIDYSEFKVTIKAIIEYWRINQHYE